MQSTRSPLVNKKETKIEEVLNKRFLKGKSPIRTDQKTNPLPPLRRGGKIPQKRYLKKY